MLAQPSKPITLVANLGVSKTGLTTIGYTLYAGDGTTFQSRRTTGVAELPTGSGSYYVTLANTVFTTDFHGQVAWDEATVPLVNEDITIEAISGGGAGDPWATDISSGYTGTEAGAVLEAVAAKTALITTGTKVTLVAPVTLSGQIALIQGDDYKASDGRALQWTSTSWPSLSSATITLELRSYSGDTTTSFDGTAISSTEAQVELTAEQTEGLAAGGWSYALKATLSDTDTVTLATGGLNVSAKP